VCRVECWKIMVFGIAGRVARALGWAALIGEPYVSAQFRWAAKWIGGTSPGHSAWMQRSRCGPVTCIFFELCLGRLAIRMEEWLISGVVRMRICYS